MDIVYVLIGFACGFLCHKCIAFIAIRRQHRSMSLTLIRMTEDEIIKRGEETTKNILVERKLILNKLNKGE